IVKDDKSVVDRFRDIALLTVTSLKNISISYSENNSTTLPGYMPYASFAGASQEPGGIAPGLPFMMGWQDKNFAYKAIRHNWITTDTTLSEPYLMSHSTSLQIRASFEMFKALKVDFTASRTHDKSMEEYYVFNEAGFDGVYNHIETGSYNMSFNIIRTAFKDVSKTGSLSSSTYNRFLASRQAIADRCASARAAISTSYSGLDATTDDGESLNGRDGYSLTSQDVLIPAFISAYSGRSTSKLFMNFLPNWTAMKPNWKVTFSGLSNIDKLKDIARNIELGHSYSAKYQVGSYTTNIEWEQAGDGLSYIRDLSNNFLPQYTVSTVTLAEQFSPLFSVSATLIKNITASIAHNRSRQIALSLANNQITETYSKEWTLSVGYRFDKLNLIFGKGENQKSTTNDLNMTFSISQRDNFTILRRIEEGVNEIASGTKTTAIKFSADYAFTQRFSMEFYYDQSLARPYVSSSYPTNNINVGVSFQLSLTQ
ncbi:MAG: cell surface protein SprA, partial [Bacteroidales bacterium]|nr:cell surface protein SprA [Bacteroidales bacterium]